MTFIRARPSADRQDRLLRALGNRQPPCIRKPHLQLSGVLAMRRRRQHQPAVHLQTASVTAMRWMSAFRAYAECISRGAYTPRSWRCQCDRPCRRMSDFCDPQHGPSPQERRASARRGSEMRWWTQCDFRRGTHAVHKSGVASARRGWAHAHRQTRAPFVGSPPTVCVRIVVAIAFKATTGGLRPPLLRRSANVCRRNSDFCDAQTYIRPRAAGRQPAVGGQIRIGRHERHSSAARRRCVCGLSLQLRLKLPRGAYAPRSCVAVRTSAGETTIFAMHKRTFAQERRASARRGSEPRWWTQCDFRRGTHAVHKSGGRQPAVVRFPSATSEVAIPKRMSRSANRHPGDAATILLTVLVAAYFRLFGVAGIEGPAERPKQALKKCRQPTRRRTCRMTPHVYPGAR
jgi:hypothetical protein